jgi:predicted nucleotidyltransferase
MPVRSLNSSVFKWPDRVKVDQAVRDWAVDAVNSREGIIRLGYFGSYARGDWGVGSDLDLVAVVDHATEPFERRSLSWDLSPLPVPAELLVYTSTEWESLLTEGSRFSHTLEKETVWVYEMAFSRPKA